METRGREIVDMDVDKLIEMLNKALADEWLAYYQYWIGSKVVKGPLRGIAAAEFQEHADEELKHANMLTDRIIQLGGTPVLKPEDWYTMTNCGYGPPEDPMVEPVVEQNLKGERCAIDVYDKMLTTIKDKDPVNYNMIVDIQEDELEHEEDLETILKDIELMKKR
jgi:bacterioferritin